MNGYRWDDGNSGLKSSSKDVRKRDCRGCGFGGSKFNLRVNRIAEWYVTVVVDQRTCHVFSVEPFSLLQKYLPIHVSLIPNSQNYSSVVLSVVDSDWDSLPLATVPLSPPFSACEQMRY